MKKVRKTILEEQIAIVKDCLSHNRNYGAMALKYNCSYQQVRNWVDCYEKIRSTGLEGRFLDKPHIRRRTPEPHSRTGTKKHRSPNGGWPVKKVRELERGHRFL